MNFTEYQEEARKTAIYPTEFSRVYPALGLAGEAGEVAEKIKKIIRDKNNQYTEEDRQAVAKELGDVLWYVANLASDFGIPLCQVAESNINKLKDRQERGVLKGSGDNR